MKRIITSLLVATLSFTLISCASKPEEPLPELPDTDQNLILAPETSFPYVVDEKLFHVQDSEALVIPFELTEAGYFKFIAYDATEYEEYTDEYWENMPQFQLAFYDEARNCLYENINITDGCAESYLLESGNITAEITYTGAVENLTEIMVSWAFAPIREEVMVATLDNKVAAKSDESETATFSFTASQDGLYRFSCFEACLWESDCHFSITNVDGTVEANNLFMHGSEWYSRLAFLLKGDYVITVTEVPNIATCLVTLEETYDSIVTFNFDNLTLPVTLGFTSNTIAPFDVHFTADGTKEKLVISTTGINSYYDYQQSFDLVIKESTGKVVLSEEYMEGNGVWDISDYRGEYVITITPHENGVMEIEVE